MSLPYVHSRNDLQHLRSISWPRYEHQRFLMSSTATMSFSSISSSSRRGMHGTTSSFMMLRPSFTSGSSPLSNMAAACSFSFCGNHTRTRMHFMYPVPFRVKLLSRAHLLKVFSSGQKCSGEFVSLLTQKLTCLLMRSRPLSRALRHKQPC